MGFASYIHSLNWLIYGNFLNESANSTAKCSQIPGAKNGTFLVGLGGFESIAELLLTNFATFLVLLLIYTCLSKKAWDYWNSHSNDSSDLSWIQLFYGDANSTVRDNISDDFKQNFPENLKKSCFFWLFAMLKIRDEHILLRTGVDGILFLTFQRHIILFVLIISFIGVFVIIPVNFQGDLESSEQYMAQTTISNLNPNSPLLWVHPTISFMYVIICLIIMRNFSALENITEKETYDKRTLMITNIPKDYRNVECLNSYFKSAYPGCTIEEIRFAFDVRRLTNLIYKRDNNLSAIEWCETRFQTTGVRPKLSTTLCGRYIKYDVFCFDQADALDFYTEKKNALLSEIENEKQTILGKPLGTAFVTLKTKEMCTMILVNDSLKKKKKEMSSTFSEVAEKWKLDYAPSAKSIYWENLAVTPKWLYLHIILVNIFLFIFVFFLTTPNIIVSAMGVLKWSETLEPLNPFLSEYIPTLVLLVLSLTLPLVVAYSDLFISYYTRSAQNISMMMKTFVYLLIMVVILPATELTSANAFIRKATTVGEERFRWECVFLPDNGAFFATYLIQTGFIGTVDELIRFPELAKYALLTCLSRSKAETVSIRKAVMWDFEFGVQYAYFLLNVAVIIIFAVPTPLVPPCGLFYLFFKHYVDRYNLYYVYTPVKLSKAVHTTAINIIILCLVVQQLTLFLSSFIRNGADIISLVYFLGFIFTITTFLVQLYMPSSVCLYWLTMPHIKKQMLEKRRLKRSQSLLSGHSVEVSEVQEADEDIPCAESFIPDVLKNDAVLS